MYAKEVISDCPYAAAGAVRIKWVAMMAIMCHVDRGRVMEEVVIM